MATSHSKSTSWNTCAQFVSPLQGSRIIIVDYSTGYHPWLMTLAPPGRCHSRVVHTTQTIEKTMTSFTCLNYHLVFSTKNREPLIDPSWQQRLYDYIGGILRQQEGVLLAAGGMPDHIHLLAGINKKVAITDALRDIKANSSGWIHEEIPRQLGFSWQAGYGAFTVSYSGLAAVRSYLATQEAHHRGQSFQEEFVELLRRHEIEFDERYIWD